MGTLRMGLHPAVGGEVHDDAGGEEAEGDGERANDPGELDAALEHEVVEDAEDEDEDGGLGEEGRAAAGGDEDELDEVLGGRLGRGHDVEVGGGGWRGGWSGVRFCETYRDPCGAG